MKTLPENRSREKNGVWLSCSDSRLDTKGSGTSGRQQCGSDRFLARERSKDVAGWTGVSVTNDTNDGGAVVVRDDGGYV